MPGLDGKADQRGKRKLDGDNDDDDENGDADDGQRIDNSCDDSDFEFVMVVPQKLTKLAQNVIYSRQATPLRYHLEGRFGSRTHRIDESHMGLPLTSLPSMDESKAQLDKAASKYEDLRTLINSEGVCFDFRSYYEPAPHKAREPPYVDARIHPEREPAGKGCNEFWKKFMTELKLKTSEEPTIETNHSVETAAAIHHIDHLSLQEKPELFTYAELFAGKKLCFCQF